MRFNHQKDKRLESQKD